MRLLTIDPHGCFVGLVQATVLLLYLLLRHFKRFDLQNDGMLLNDSVEVFGYEMLAGCSRKTYEYYR